MNTRAISAIVRKDVAVALRTKAVALPLLLVPLLLMVGVPLLLGGIVIVAESMGVSSGDIEELQERDSAADCTDAGGPHGAAGGAGLCPRVHVCTHVSDRAADGLLGGGRRQLCRRKRTQDA